MSKKYMITTPIYYVNDIPHLGHAYTSIACDMIARFKRLDGFEVLFSTGTDEHGQKIEQSALKKGMTPQELTDGISKKFEDLSSLLNLSNDYFVRTTSQAHQKTAQTIWKVLEANGFIYLDDYKGWYSVRDEAYYAEDELSTNETGERIAPTGAICEWVEEPSYFFKLSAFEAPLLKFYQDNPDFIAPTSRRNEVMRFVEGGLRDLSISRTSFSWGVPVPGAPKHITYVWLDALTNYLTVTKDQKDFWPANLHMVGKDILRFHAVYWPAFLMAAKLPLPKKVFAHGWWMIEGKKMSKSLGNVIAPETLTSTYGIDATRYFLMREVSFGQDGNFSSKAMKTRINSDLANDLGNLVQRVLSMVVKHCGSQVPSFSEISPILEEEFYPTLPKLRALVDSQSLHKYLEQVWHLSALANRYIDHQAPWALRKTDPAAMENVLYNLLEMIRVIAIFVQVIMPESALKILGFLNVTARDFDAIHTKLQSKTSISAPEALFPRIDT